METATAQGVLYKENYTMTITSNPVHDAAMHDIEMRQESELTPEEEEKYPVCDICEERILPGEKYYEFAGFYLHDECLPRKEMEWK